MIASTLLFVVFATVLLTLFSNKSNFPRFVMIPLIVGLLTKYLMGDWDLGYSWTRYDIAFWASVIGTSLATLFVLNAKDSS